MDIYGDEDTLKARIDALKGSELALEADLVELVDKYAGGWRPDDGFERAQRQEPPEPVD